MDMQQLLNHLIGQFKDPLYSATCFEEDYAGGSAMYIKSCIVSDFIKEAEKEIRYREQLLKEQYKTVQMLAYPDLNLTDDMLNSMFNVYKIEKQIP